MRFPTGSAPTARTPNPTRPTGSRPKPPSADFAAQRSFLLPPTWTQLDALAGRTVAEVLAVERRIVAVSPNMSMTDGNLEFEFFDGERYNQALGGPHPVREFVSIHTLDEHPGIATLLLSRPPTNALTRQMCREIIAAAAELGARDDIAAVILFGGHEIFCAGDDVTVLQTLNAEEAAGAAEVGREAVDALARDPQADRRRDHRLRAWQRADTGPGRGLAGGRRQHQGRRDRDPRRAFRRGGRPGWPARSARARPRIWCSPGGSSTPRRHWHWA